MSVDLERLERSALLAWLDGWLHGHAAGAADEAEHLRQQQLLAAARAAVRATASAPDFATLQERRGRRERAKAVRADWARRDRVVGW
ncbi:hypothetical protein [Kineococcus terrestris]|uniref:hypothetical protein n=1 Tax=Kineococcus terrestris TaxID=2044856 RepID=UPI0034DB5942